MSRTVIKPQAGFRAELPGLDLPTLLQMTCARRERQVVRIASYGEEGFIFSADGRIVHATLGSAVGDEAVLRMLSWTSGEFAIVDKPFPGRPSIDASTEGLLLRAAQRSDEQSRQRPTIEASLQSLPPADELEPEDQLDEAGDEVPTLIPLARDETARKIPPPPPAALRKSFVRGEPVHDASLLASVRVDAFGELVSASGESDLLAQLVAYVGRLIALLRADFSLDPFEALHAELCNLRVLVFQDAGELVGLMMRPGSAAQELRRRLGV